MFVVNTQSRLLPLITLLSIVSLLCSCASSNVSRTASSNIDLGRTNTSRLADDATSGDIAGSYQNMSQRTKGAILGGVAGGAVGSLVGSTVGTIPGAIAGVVLGASYGAYIDSETSLRDRLENRGAIIVELGDRILIVFPSVRLFDDMTPHLKAGAYSTLALTVQYINRFTKMLVKIAVYTNDDTARSSDLLLSQQQADAVADVFVSQGIDARLLYAVGYGSKQFVEKTSLSWDETLNYRVEISLEKLYV